VHGATAPIARSAADPLDLDFEAPLDPAVWSPQDPAVAIDHDVVHGGSGSLRIRSLPGTGDSHEARAVLPIDRVRGHWIHLTGWIRTRDFTGWRAGMWLRVDGPDHVVYGRVNTSDRHLTGTTDWTRPRRGGCDAISCARSMAGSRNELVHESDADRPGHGVIEHGCGRWARGRMPGFAAHGAAAPLTTGTCSRNLPTCRNPIVGWLSLA
jgi:hypothetical protein